MGQIKARRGDLGLDICLSTSSQQYFSLRTNQPPAISQQYFSLRTNQHQPSATSQTNRLMPDFLFTWLLHLGSSNNFKAIFILR
jgi:hypothetical protein